MTEMKPKLVIIKQMVAALDLAALTGFNAYRVCLIKGYRLGSIHMCKAPYARRVIST